MKAMVLYGKHDLRCEEIEVPKISSDEVLVRVYACSVCGSDLFAYEGKHPRLVFPRILGHEFAGTIEAVGSNVKHIKVGQRVCCGIDVVCGKCSNCLEGRTNICNELKTIGFARDGAYAQFVAVPAYLIYPINDNISFDEASIIQVLGIGYHAIAHRAKVESGEKIAVIGAGPIGLGAAAAAKALGAHVTSIDLIDERLELAKKLGINEIINSNKEDLEDRALEITGNRGFDKVVECVGGRQEKTIQDAFKIARRGGKIIVVGTFSDNKATIPIFQFKDNEMDLIGSVGDFQAFEPCLDLVYKGLIKPKDFITHTFPLTEAEKALQLLRDKNEFAFKIILHPQEDN